MRGSAESRRWVYFVILVFGALFLDARAHAQDRIALVIGNAKYSNTPRLVNTFNDAADVTAAFKRLGFSVTSLFDADFAAMRRAMLDFSHATQGASVAVVYFAGHGIEIGGQNYLIPIDAELKYDRDVEHESISLRSVIETVGAARRLGLVVLDACRNDPFRARMTQTAELTRSVTRGLARVEPAGNVLVAFAAREGMVADDGGARNSPFTTAFLENIATRDLDVRLLFGRVRDKVLAATRRQQEPVIYGALGGDPIVLAALAPAEKPSPSPSPSPSPTHSPQTTASFGDWVVRCELTPGSPPQKTCDMEQLAQVQGQDAPISRVAIPLPPKGEPAKLFVQLPINVMFAAPLKISVDSKDPGISTPFSRCVPAGCFAEIELNDGLQKRFRASGEPGKLQFKDAAGRDVAIPLSFKGFAQAFDSLLKQ